MRDWGQGTKYFDKKQNRYVYQIRYTTKNGEHKRKTITSRSKKILNRKIARWREEYEKSMLTSVPALTVEQLAKIWLDAIKTNIKANTYYQYKYAAKYIVQEYSTTKLDELKSVDIQIFLNRLYETTKLSARTVNIVRNVFRNMCGFAVRNNFTISNPLLNVRTIRDEHKTPVALSEEQLEKLLEVAKSGNYYPGADVFSIYLKKCFYVAVNLAAKTGMRRGEVFGLSWSDINFADKLINVKYTLSASRKLTSPKTSSSKRNILLDDDTVCLLQHWHDFQDDYDRKYHGIYENRLGLVFTTGHGTAVSLDNFRERHWRAMTAAAGMLGFNFHGLRHTHATLLLKAGVNVKVVAERLGHADVAITMRTYAHVLPTMQQSAVDAIKKISSHVSARLEKDSD